MNNIRTVSDTKKTFYSIHTRPINSIYARVVEELMVEMHLVSVNLNFAYNPFYALGVVTAFDRFMQGYAPEVDKESIFSALIKAQEDDPQKYRADAKRLEDVAKYIPELVSWLSLKSTIGDRYSDLQECLKAIAHNPNFKYSRLFAIGLFSFIEIADTELVKNESRRLDAFKSICQALNLPEEKLLKDLDLYRDNLEKISQARRVMEDTLLAARKKREQRVSEKKVASIPPSENSK
ncbi:MAG: photosystem II biogenesis protein Psp29 [Okeania sp. SIO2H7]|nr:photosystem II biogenesis protein Psp29 [Okeania sp. SIO2H7]